MAGELFDGNVGGLPSVLFVERVGGTPTKVLFNGDLGGRPSVIFDGKERGPPSVMFHKGGWATNWEGL